MITREQYDWRGGTAAVIVAVVSVIAAINPHSKLWSLADHEAWGKIIVFIWAVFPPAFFWLDWVYFCDKENVSKDNREIAKHTHDLARNIWLGLLAILAFSFFKVKF
jgi:hypothetical protein